MDNRLWHTVIFIIVHSGQYSVTADEDKDDGRRTQITVPLTVVSQNVILPSGELKPPLPCVSCFR